MKSKTKTESRAGGESRGVLPELGLLLGVLLLAVPWCPAAPDSETELTLPQFRALIQARNLKEKAPDDLRQSGEVFSRLLSVQAKIAAARQSLDRLAGWSKAAQVRMEAQSAAALDVELLEFSEAKMAAEIAALEAERRQLLQQANALLGRASGSPLVAVMQPPGRAAAGASEEPKNSSQSPAASAPAPPAPPQPEAGPGPESPRAVFEKQLLPQGQEVLAKMYQSYLFGGISLPELLWQERQVYDTDLRYRLLLVDAELERWPSEQAP